MRWFVFSLLVLAVLAGTGYLFSVRVKSGPAAPGVENSPPASPGNPEVFYPLDRYSQRVTVHWYGKLVRPGDEKSLSCGRPFSGYHTGDDLEILSGEMNVDVPVFSATDGRVVELGTLSGYGGLLVTSGKLAGSDLTFYYGHINLASVRVTVGDRVRAGQVMASLGQACSAQTDGERKHLHFAIHRGTGVEVRGYVDSQTELSNWLNPGEVLKAAGAVSPTSPL